MKIFYGLNNSTIEVTHICLEKLNYNNVITIPACDNVRAKIFGDPLFGIKKIVSILINGNVNSYDDSYIIKINLNNNNLETIAIRNHEIENKLKNIHSRLKINYGSFMEELPEQRMAVRYLTGKEKVLELGGNIGRNSLVIASILEDSQNLVTLEIDHNISNQLIENRYINNLQFHVESSALSKRKLLQKGWDTLASDTLIEGYNWVDIINLDELNAKYNIKFDTLILDCEGAFYYILLDMPEILDNINLIIMENDYVDISHKQYINNILIKNNFYRDYIEPLGFISSLCHEVCGDFFFEVWKRDI
jgi:FkbM family methyltransferase